MISPCYKCTKRTPLPNCHADCQEYAKYNAWCEYMRAKRHAAGKLKSYVIERQQKEKRT